MVFFYHRAPLDNETGKREIILRPDFSANASPLSLSMDWLNNHLYILEEIRNPVNISILFYSILANNHVNFVNIFTVSKNMAYIKMRSEWFWLNGCFSWIDETTKSY